MASLVASTAGVDVLKVASGYQDAGAPQRPAAPLAERTATSSSRAPDEVTLSSIARMFVGVGSTTWNDTAPRDGVSSPQRRSTSPVATADSAPLVGVDLARAYKALIAFLDQVSPSEKASGSWITRRINAQYSYEQALRSEEDQGNGTASSGDAGRSMQEIVTFLSSMKEGRAKPELEAVKETAAVAANETPVPAIETVPAQRPGFDIRA